MNDSLFRRTFILFCSVELFDVRMYRVHLEDFGSFKGKINRDRHSAIC